MGRSHVQAYVGNIPLSSCKFCWHAVGGRFPIVECELRVTAYVILQSPHTKSSAVHSCASSYLLIDCSSHTDITASITCCFCGAQKPTEIPFWKDIFPLFQQLSRKELQMFPGNHTWQHGWKYTTLICDSQQFLRYLNQRFHEVCMW